MIKVIPDFLFVKTSYLQVLILLLCSSFIRGAEWQWSVEITDAVSGETNDHPRAFLWIPPSCEKVRGVVVGCHNMLEEPIFEHVLFRQEMEKLGFAEIWITPGLDPLYDPATEIQEQFNKMFTSLAEVSGYEELKTVPVIPIGHSAYASYPWNYAACNPERTLAILSIKGDAPRTHLTGCGRANVEWGEHTIEGIPGLMVMGEYEWWTDRLMTAFDYRREYPHAPVSVLADAGRGHFDISDSLVEYLALFIRKAAANRLDVSGRLIPVDAFSGWLAPCWEPERLRINEAAPYHQYKGCKEKAFWYFDKEMVEATKKIYEAAHGKKEQYLGFQQNGELLSFNPESHARIQPVFQPEDDGLTFRISALFTDTLRSQPVSGHAGTSIEINRICGPVEKINDTTFTVRFYRMGLDNQKRTGDIWLLAENKGDTEYKSTVQQLNMRIPFRNTEGAKQTIAFPFIEDTSKQTSCIKLKATTDSGLDVYYYIKEGPAEIKRNNLYFTQIPPKSKYPIKVTVVAWQYGKITDPQIQTAEAVERTFYIKEK